MGRAQSSYSSSESLHESFGSDSLTRVSLLAEASSERLDRGSSKNGALAQSGQTVATTRTSDAESSQEISHEARTAILAFDLRLAFLERSCHVFGDVPAAFLS